MNNMLHVTMVRGLIALMLLEKNTPIGYISSAMSSFISYQANFEEHSSAAFDTRGGIGFVEFQVDQEDLC